MAYHKDSFINQAQYNALANREMFEILSQLPEAERTKDTGSYFGSIMDILNHVIIADYFWLNRVKPVLPESKVLGDPRLLPAKLSWSQPLHTDFTEFRRDRVFLDGRILAWLEECPEQLYSREFEYHDSEGILIRTSAGRAMDFMFSHQLHHRGQISQILDQMGVENNWQDVGKFLKPGD